MTLGHMPGSIDLAHRVFGTAPARTLGTIPASKFYGGTFSRPVAGAYGSYGTFAGRLIRAQMGSFRGTVSAHRAMITAYPGTWRQRTTGTFNTWYPAPPRARLIAISLFVTPNSTNVAITTLRQSLLGTIGHAGIQVSATETDEPIIIGWLLPGRGSYVLGTQAGGGIANGIGVRRWMEWDP